MQYLGPVYSRMTEDRGRGVFAARDIKEGEFIMVEKPIADSTNVKLKDEDVPKLGVLFKIQLAERECNLKVICDLVKKMRSKKLWMAQAV